MSETDTLTPDGLEVHNMGVGVGLFVRAHEHNAAISAAQAEVAREKQRAESNGILAHEAGCRAEGLRAALEPLLDGIERIGYSTGVCCCGGDVDRHTIGDGHSPVDSGEYYMAPLIEAARQALNQGKE